LDRKKIKRVFNGSWILVKFVDIIKITQDLELGDIYGKEGIFDKYIKSVTLSQTGRREILVAGTKT